MIGEGASAKVFAVDIPGYPQLCIKYFKHRARKEEPYNMLRLSRVPGIPRFVAACNYPPTILMTRHGSVTLRSMLKYDEPFAMTEKLLCEIFRQLTIILQAMHNEGFAHNDLKSD